ncbi:DEAD/DEAH box RNA helicase [Phytophthora palmivora]|uniref:DEAD/DEAH box RNA helicase n=1 Tax=Phytophthora palmivora TaxID=4796 RepID=A0A2P4YJE6_9STRA|nr:DEAD/DEAH box RNA helicase [Phytophthora palmivora]
MQSNKKLFVFRELMDIPNVDALKYKKHYEMLRVFCFGMYNDYLGKKNCRSSIGCARTQIQGRHNIPYDTLMQDLGVSMIRTGLIQGKLD